MSQPKISVIVPVYNAEPYLRGCLNSIIGQTYRRLEIILIDDGSSDNSGAICDAYAFRDSRIFAFHQKNSGAAAARNAGLNAATGDWIGFVDSDDTIEPDQYEYLLDLAQRHGADIAQCGIFVETGDSSQRLFSPEKELCVNAKEVWRLQSIIATSNCCRLYSRSLLSHLYFDTKYRIGEDVLFNLEAFKRANRIAFGREAKYHYVQNPDSICNALPSEEALVSVRNMYAFAEQRYSDRPDIRRFCRENKLRNDLDISSKLARYDLEAGNERLLSEIRKELRTLCGSGFDGVEFTRKEKLKSMLIGYAWNLYKRILPRKKRGN